MLIQFRLRSTDNSRKVWASIQQLAWRSTFAQALATWLSLFISEIVVGTGSIDQVTQPWKTMRCCYIADLRMLKIQTLDPSKPDEPLRVNLRTFKFDLHLTEAFLNPSTLPDDDEYIAKNEQFLLDLPSIGTQRPTQDAMIIRKVISITKLARLFTVLIFSSPGFGTLAGTLTHKAEVGIAVSVGFIALASSIQGYAAIFNTWYLTTWTQGVGVGMHLATLSKCIFFVLLMVALRATNTSSRCIMHWENVRHFAWAYNHRLGPQLLLPVR